MSKVIGLGIKKIMLLMLAVYRSALSPLLGGNCRFEPSCSTYAADAIQKYSPYKSLVKIIVRLFKCHPFSRGGWDPA